MKRFSAIIPILMTGLLPSVTAHSETLPWLEDPFGGREKIAVYGTKLKPLHCPAIPENKKDLTLSQVVTLSLCNNPDSRTAYLSLLNSADTFASGFSAYLPNISASASRSRSRNFSERRDGKTNIGGDPDGSISASMTLYDFGQRELTIEAAEKTLAIAGMGYDQSMQSAISTAINSYYNLLTAQNALDVAVLTEKRALESYDAARLRHELGLVPLKDKLDAEVAYLEAQLSRETSLSSLATSRASLAQIMGLSAQTEISVAEVDDSNLLNDPFAEADVSSLIEKAKQQRLDLISSRKSLEAARIGLQKTKRSNLATISASVSGGYDDTRILKDTTTRSQSIGVNISIPIFTGFTQTYNTRIAETGIKSQEEGIRRTELSIEKSVWDAWNNYKTSRRNWEISWDRLRVAGQSRDITLGRYKEGLGTILDVLSAETAYRSALNSQLSTRLGLLTSRLQLINAVGALNLETMEPEAKAIGSEPVTVE